MALEVNFKVLKAELEYLHKGDPSLVQRLTSALQSVEDGLQVLAARGHHWHLVEGHVAPPAWPRPMFHFKLGRRLVYSEWELQDLGPGWYSSPRDAEFAEGRDVQFAGRGGWRRRNLPQTNGSEAHFVPVGPSKEELKEIFLKGRPRGLGPILSDSPK